MPHFPRLCTIFFCASLLLSGCKEIPPQASGSEQSSGRTVSGYTLPPTPLREEPRAIPRNLEAKKSAAAPLGARTVKVALLVPMSGESATLGNAMVDAASLALFEKYNKMNREDIATKLVIVPKDTGATPEQAKAAAHEAVKDGAELILGPLYSQSVDAVASVARAKNINVISFSNNRAVLRPGVFLFGFMPSEQVERVASFATHHNYNRFALLAPSDAYGALAARQFQQTVKAAGATIDPLELYVNDEGREASVRKVATAYQAKETVPQALFIAEGGEKLATLVASLAKRGVTSQATKFIGTGLWDDPTLAGVPQLDGAWFASAPPERYGAFEARFRSHYGYAPPRLASLAYDAAALAATLALDEAGPDFSTRALTDKAGFSGPANGIFRFRSDGTNERGLAVIQITHRGFEEIDPAPRSF